VTEIEVVADEDDVAARELLLGQWASRVAKTLQTELAKTADGVLRAVGERPVPAREARPRASPKARKQEPKGPSPPQARDAKR
jgi:hypothetical protein